MCTQCHDPHSPGLSVPKSSAEVTEGAADSLEKSDIPDRASIASNCFSCHGPLGRGGFAPVLAGQSYELLKNKLTKFRSGELTGTMMNPIAIKMKDEEIDALARYFAELS